MPKKNGTLIYQDIFRRLKPFGVQERPARQSQFRHLVKPGADGKGPFCTVGIRHEADEVSQDTLRMILRRFEIDEANFWR